MVARSIPSLTESSFISSYPKKNPLRSTVQRATALSLDVRLPKKRILCNEDEDRLPFPPLCRSDNASICPGSRSHAKLSTKLGRQQVVVESPISARKSDEMDAGRHGPRFDISKQTYLPDHVMNSVIEVEEASNSNEKLERRSRLLPSVSSQQRAIARQRRSRHTTTGKIGDRLAVFENNLKKEPSAQEKDARKTRTKIQSRHFRQASANTVLAIAA